MFNTLANRIISNKVYDNNKKYISNERKEYRSGVIGGLNGRKGDSDGMTYAKDSKIITPPTERWSKKEQEEAMGVKFKEADIGGGMSGGGIGKPDYFNYKEGGSVRYPPIENGPFKKVPIPDQGEDNVQNIKESTKKPAGITIGSGLGGAKKKAGRPKGSKNKKTGGSLQEIREGGSKKVWDVVDKIVGGNKYVNEQAKEDGMRGAGKRGNPLLKKVMEIRTKTKCSLKDAWDLARKQY